MDDFSFALIKGAKDNTYKFALGRFILDFVKDNKNIKEYKIQYSEIAEAFLKYYWNQIVVFFS